MTTPIEVSLIADSLAAEISEALRDVLILTKWERNRYSFLLTVLELYCTFVDVARMKLNLDKREHAERILHMAEMGYTAIERLPVDLENAEWLQDIEMKLIDLRMAIDSVKADLKHPAERSYRPSKTFLG